MAAQAEAQVKLSLLDRLTAPMRRIEARMAMLSRRLGFERIGGSVGHLSQRVVGLGDSLMATTGRISAFVGALGLGAGGAIAGAFGLANSTSELSKQILNLAQVAGSGAEEFQKYAFAAETVGIEHDKFADILKDVNDKVGDYLITGGGPLKDFFEQIAPKVGLTAEAFRDLSGPDALQLFFNALEDADLTNAEITFFMEALASDATALVPLLRDGGVEMRRLAQEAVNTGNVLGKDALEAGDRFSESMQRLTGRLEGVRNVAGAHLLPVMDDVVVKMTAWIDANQGLIRSTISDWVERFSVVLTDLTDPASSIRESIADIGMEISAFADALMPVVDFLGGPMQATFLALGTWVMAPVLTSLALISGAFIKLGAVILTTPIGWIVGGLALIGAAAYVLVQKWGGFVDYWANLWVRIHDAFEVSFLHGISAMLREFNPVVHIARGIDAVIEYFTGISLLDEGTAFVRSFLQGVTDGIADFGDWVGGHIDKNIEIIRSKAASLYDVGRDLIQSMWDGIRSMWGEVQAWLQDAVANLLPNWTPDWIKDRLGFSGGGAVTAPTADTSAASEAVTRLPAITVSAADINRARYDNGVPTGPGGDVTTNTVDAGTVTTNNFEAPEPLLVHEPQSIDARSTYHLTINAPPGSDAREMAAIARRELDKANREHESRLRSRLND